MQLSTQVAQRVAAEAGASVGRFASNATVVAHRFGSHTASYPDIRQANADIH